MGEKECMNTGNVYDEEYLASPANKYTTPYSGKYGYGQWFGYIGIPNPNFPIPDKKKKEVSPREDLEKYLTNERESAIIHGGNPPEATPIKEGFTQKKDPTKKKCNCGCDGSKEAFCQKTNCRCPCCKMGGTEGMNGDVYNQAYLASPANYYTTPYSGPAGYGWYVQTDPKVKNPYAGEPDPYEANSAISDRINREISDKLVKEMYPNLETDTKEGMGDVYGEKYLAGPVDRYTTPYSGKYGYGQNFAMSV